MVSRASRTGFLLVVGLAAGCATMKTGAGSGLSGANPVKFSWMSPSNASGSLTAEFANGVTFTGPFSQATSRLTDELGSQGPIWHQEGPYDVSPELQYVPHYTGRVVANLTRSDGAQMQCRFNLMRPVEGMAGGACGECRLPNGMNVDVQFPPD
jgi:hypothetical protein